MNVEKRLLPPSPIRKMRMTSVAGHSSVPWNRFTNERQQPYTANISETIEIPRAAYIHASKYAKDIGISTVGGRVYGQVPHSDITHGLSMTTALRTEDQQLFSRESSEGQPNSGACICRINRSIFQPRRSWTRVKHTHIWYKKTTRRIHVKNKQERTSSRTSLKTSLVVSSFITSNH